MTAAPDFTTPAQALREMIAAGATFKVHRRDDGLGMSFTYNVADGGDQDRCRDILAAVKAKPAPFYEAFKAQVQGSVASSARGAA